MEFDLEELKPIQTQPINTRQEQLLEEMNQTESKNDLLSKMVNEIKEFTSYHCLPIAEKMDTKYLEIHMDSWLNHFHK